MQKRDLCQVRLIWFTFRRRGYQAHELVVIIIVIVVQFCLCCSLFVMAITDNCALFHIYRPPRRKVNIIYSMPPACRTPKPRCKCEQSATSEKKNAKREYCECYECTSVSWPRGNLRFFFYSCYGTTSCFHFSTFSHAAGESTDQIRWACVGDTVQNSILLYVVL